MMLRNISFPSGKPRGEPLSPPARFFSFLRGWSKFFRGPVVPAPRERWGSKRRKTKTGPGPEEEDGKHLGTDCSVNQFVSWAMPL